MESVLHLVEQFYTMRCPSEIKELLKLLYNLSGSETEVMYYLCDNEARASDIADELGKDRSTVQRYLSKLRSVGLVEREGVVEEGKRGRYYVYSVPDKQDLKAEIERRMEEWEKDRLEVLEDL